MKLYISRIILGLFLLCSPFVLAQHLSKTSLKLKETATCAKKELKQPQKAGAKQQTIL